MADKTIPDDKVRDLHRLADKVLANTDSQHCTAIALANLVKEAAPALPLSTLADMTREERAACKWMQADTETWGRAVIILPDVGGGRAVTLDRWGHVAYEAPDRVIPRPDLPRMEWPGDQKAAPALALPDGWRLADHPDHGRVIVTRTETDRDGEVAITVPVPIDDLAARFEWCRPAELTYIDTEKIDTSDAAPESTLAVGSAWEDVDALTLACKESERDQITVIDCDGDMYVWGADAGWWETGLPDYGFEPYTILHPGKPVAP